MKKPHVADRHDRQGEGVEVGELPERERADPGHRLGHSGRQGIAAALQEGEEEPAAEGTPRRVHGADCTPWVVTPKP
jgi:hypothetical protein